MNNSTTERLNALAHLANIADRHVGRALASGQDASSEQAARRVHEERFHAFCDLHGVQCCLAPLFCA